MATLKNKYQHFLSLYKDNGEGSDLLCMLGTKGGKFHLGNMQYNWDELYEILCEKENDKYHNFCLSEVVTNNCKLFLDIDADDSFIWDEKKANIVIDNVKYILPDVFTLDIKNVQTDFVINCKKRNRLKIWFHNVFVNDRERRYIINRLKQTYISLPFATQIKDIDHFYDIPTGNRLIYAKKFKIIENEEEEKEEKKTRKVIDLQSGFYNPQPRTIETFRKYSIRNPDNIILPLKEDYLKIQIKLDKIRQKVILNRKEIKTVNKDTLDKIILTIDNDVYYQWIYALKILINLGYEEKELITWSQKSDNYSQSANYTIIQLINNYSEEQPFGYNEEKRPNGYDFKDLLNILKRQLGKDDYKKFEIDNMIYKDWQIKYLWNADLGMGELVKILYKDTIKITWQNGDHCYGYKWDESSKLWITRSKENIMNDLLNPILQLVNDMTIGTKAKDAADIKDELEQKEQIRINMLWNVKRNLTKTTARENYFKACIGFLQDFEFKNILNLCTTWSFPLKNGKLYDVKTGLIRDRIVTDIWTWELPYCIVDDTSRGEEYISDLCDNDLELTQELIDIVGYCYTPSNHLKLGFVLIGPANCGKTTFINFVSKGIGEFFSPCSQRAIINQKNASNHDDELIRASKNTLLMVPSELRTEQHLNEEVWKNIVGNDLVQRRACRGSAEKITTYCKILFGSNQQFLTTGTDDITSKIYYFEFNHRYETTPENGRKMELLKEDDSFINELVTIFYKSATKFYKTRKISTNDKTKNTNRKYKVKADTIESWFEENCEINEEYKDLSDDVHSNYETYCTIEVNQKMVSRRELKNKILEIGKTKFTYILKGRLTKKDQDYNTSLWKGFRLKVIPEEEITDVEKNKSTITKFKRSNLPSDNILKMINK